MFSKHVLWMSIPEDLKQRFLGVAAPALRGTLAEGWGRRGNWLDPSNSASREGEALEALGPDPRRHFLLSLQFCLPHRSSLPEMGQGSLQKVVWPNPLTWDSF